MDDIAKLERAKQVYADVCRVFDERNWHYNRHDDDLVVDFVVSGDDIPMQFILDVDVKRQIIRMFSPMPFKMAEDKRLEGAIASCVATYGLPDGSFDYNMADGSLSFRMTASFRDSKIGDKLISYLIDASSAITDNYNDKFLALNKGIMSLEQFIEKG